jgi:hypothetical protein
MLSLDDAVAGGTLLLKSGDMPVFRGGQRRASAGRMR